MRLAQTHTYQMLRAGSMDHIYLSNDYVYVAFSNVEYKYYETQHPLSIITVSLSLQASSTLLDFFLNKFDSFRHVSSQFLP